MPAPKKTKDQAATTRENAAAPRPRGRPRGNPGSKAAPGRNNPAERAQRGAESAIKGRVLAFYEANRSRKALEREESGHKEWFKEQAGMFRPFSFEADGVIVTVTDESSERLDLEALRKVVTPDIIAACTKPSTCTKVTVRLAKESEAA